MPEWLGWAATAVFTASYFCKDAGWLRRVQMLGALMWVVYGLASHARPVVAANLLVLTAAAISTWRPSRERAASIAVDGRDARNET
jgi:inner membrane protein